MKKLILLITVWLTISHSLQAQTSSFTYQGHLMDGGSSANGNYDILFTLKNALDSGSTVGTPQAVAPVSAVNGIFTVTLDFGSAPFDGSDRWVELAVRPAGSSDPYTVLSPRQKITATPYSVRALNATNLTGAISGANIPSGTITGAMLAGGTISGAQLASGLTLGGTTTGTFSGNLTGNVSGSAASFTGNLLGDVTGTQGATVVASVGGSSAANVNAATLLANAATSSNTNGTIVRRDANGSFHAGTITLSSSLRLPATTSDGAGVIMRNGLLFIHGVGTDTFFAGPNAGNLTMTGGSNTAVGASAMFSNTSGANNVAVGHFALGSNTTGTGMVAVGATALMGNTTGAFNTGIGQGSLLSNTTGTSNTATGYASLYSNTVGRSNTSLGNWSMFNNTNASQNVAIGESALTSQSYGGAGFWNSRNVAVGYRALFANQPVSLVTGANNTAIGTNALQANSTGANNIALGSNAGSLLTTGNDNIAIGHVGVAGESGVIRLGTTGTHTKTFAAGIRGITTGLNDAVSVVIDSNGQLGTISSSRRYKEDIADMGDTSARLQALRPVTFRYKQPSADGARPVQFGLIAEEVAEVFPELAVFDKEGRPETVKYQDLAPLLLNEVQKLRTENDGLARQLAERKAKDKERDERIARLESLLSPTGSTAQTKGN